MPGSKLVEERTQWSQAKIIALQEAVTALPDVTTHTDLCIYVTGSFGRLEASAHSDLDLFFIKETGSDQEPMSRIHKTLMDASLISECRKLTFPDFSGDGEYLEVHYLEAMRQHLGGRRDDYDNLFTARLLLLLESLPIYNEPLYDRVLQEITKSYFRDYEGHAKDFRPTFLVNDIIRFWKTLCLNYEHSRNTLPSEDTEAINKSQLKNLKLKFSRMLTCFSLVIPLAVPRGSIDPPECVSLMKERPLERLRKVAAEFNQGTLWESLVEDYAWFLESTGRPRDEVLEWIGRPVSRKEVEEHASSFGDTMYQLLAAVSDKSTMRYLVI